MKEGKGNTSLYYTALCLGPRVGTDKLNKVHLSVQKGLGI